MVLQLEYIYKINLKKLELISSISYSVNKCKSSNQS